jgi:hypothetical protein
MGSFSQGPRCAVSALRSSAVRVAFVTCLLAACATGARAQTGTQTGVRVTQDQSTIWQSNFATAAAVVDSGTVLTVVRRSGDWYEVLLPGGQRTGFIYKGNIDDSWSVPPRAVGFLGFVQFGYTQFAARNSFEAVLGQPGGGFLGGGAEVRIGKGFFVNGSVERFTKTGQGVFVVNGEVFKLGTPDTITMTPIGFTAGWRFAHEHVTPYAGGGAGRVLYKETLAFGDPGEDVDTRSNSYHLLGGVEFRNGWVATAFEFQYSRVPNALGTAGASAAFGESSLGGLGGRIKILVGR